MEKEMATHSSIFAWRILWTEEPGGLLSMGLHRVRHDWSDLAAAVQLNDLIYFQMHYISHTLHSHICFVYVCVCLGGAWSEKKRVDSLYNPGSGRKVYAQLL